MTHVDIKIDFRYLCNPYPATPLTLDNVLAAVKKVRDLRGLGNWLLGWWSYKLNDIERQHVSDEACLKAVVETFLVGKGVYQPSWRAVIHALHNAGESRLAKEIKTNAEPHQGEWAGDLMISVYHCMK